MYIRQTLKRFNKYRV